MKERVDKNLGYTIETRITQTNKSERIQMNGSNKKETSMDTDGEGELGFTIGKKVVRDGEGDGGNRVSRCCTCCL